MQGRAAQRLRHMHALLREGPAWLDGGVRCEAWGGGGGGGGGGGPQTSNPRSYESCAGPAGSRTG